MADFEMIFEQNRGFIYRYLLKLCKNSSLAEELTQETFFRAYMNFASLRNEEKTSSWLCRIAKNAYFAWYNENKHSCPLEEELAVSGAPDISDVLVDKELAQKAYRCLHELEEPYKEVFMLSVLGGLSFTDISALFGKSDSWARVTFYRAKQKLIDRMR